MNKGERHGLSPLARRDDEPVFDEPWQAQALAVANSLVAQGLFSARDWSEALGAALRRAAADRAPDNSATYYEAVLAALEDLTNAGGAVTKEAMAARQEAWRQAYLKTPHGQPVALSGDATGRPSD